MKVQITFEWDTEDRKRLSQYMTIMYGGKYPKLATREMIQHFIEVTVGKQEVYMGDVLESVEELKNAGT